MRNRQITKKTRILISENGKLQKKLQPVQPG